MRLTLEGPDPDDRMFVAPPIPLTVYRLPWRTPPLSLNDRLHWRAKAARVQTIRNAAALAVRSHQQANRIRVTLHYFPKDGRRRDADNLVATLKPLCDGIVDAGVVPDDDPAHMMKAMPVIGAPDPRDPHMELWIEVLAR